MNRKIEYFFSFPKSLYFNLKYFPIRIAFRFPVFISYHTHLLALKGYVILSNSDKIKTGQIKIGFGQVGVYDKKYSRSVVELYGRIVFEGIADFGHGTKIVVGENGYLTIGNGFSNTAEIKIICFDKVTIGTNVITSWEVLIMDTDFHAIQDTVTNELSPYHSPILIDDNVWIGTKALILKGSNIPKGCIIGASALVNKKFTEDNCLIAGNPAKICKQNVSIFRD
ncbi:MAG: acyltransferase [Candidatus Azobacteroides sp.]|nr:acyltransferase [Candidatus Azobacteroides sp.]